MMTRIFFPVLILAVLVSSCEFIDRQRERGNGHVTTDNRSPKNFKGIEAYGDFDVYASTGNDYSVKVEADENLQQYIKTSVEDGYLKISTKEGVSIDPSGSLKVYITAPNYDKLSSSGSGNIKGQNEIVSNGKMDVDISGSGDIDANVKADEIETSISGSGNIKLSGEAKTFKTSIAGNGNVEVDKLHVEEATVEIMGSGDALINASKKLNVHIAGSGDVKYAGNPEIHQEVMGSGNIQKVD